MTQHGILSCSSCGNPIPAPTGPGSRFITCPVCGAELTVELFPAFFRGLRPGLKGDILQADGEASCFYHESKRAVVPCDGCGRFLCALCEMRIGNRILCPVCIEKGRADGSMEVLETRRILYDGLALLLSLAPVAFVVLALCCPLLYIAPLVTVPLSLYYAIRSWKMPGSILPRTKVRPVLAIIFAVLQIATWVGIITLLIYDES